MINPNAFNMFPEDPGTFSITGLSLTVLTLTPFGSRVTWPGSCSGFTVVGLIVGHGLGMARPSQVIPVSHSSMVTTALSPKKS